MLTILSSSAKYLAKGIVGIVVGAIAIVVLAVITYVTIPLVLTLVGYKVNANTTEVATMAATIQDVSQCKRIISYGFFGPPTGDVRRTCVRTYAEITQDPTICELLMPIDRGMPNDYGWLCIGAATEKEPCLFDFKESPEVRGNGIIVQLSQCVHGDAATQNNTCCAMARIAFYDENGDCSSLAAPQNFINQCHHEFAKKRIDMDACAKIESTNIRTACEVEVRTLMKERK